MIALLPRLSDILLYHSNLMIALSIKFNWNCGIKTSLC